MQILEEIFILCFSSDSFFNNPFFVLFYREEVLREQFGIGMLASARGGTAAGPSNQAAGNDEPQEVSPEFLAALPPEVQQEVRMFDRFLIEGI